MVVQLVSGDARGTGESLTASALDLPHPHSPSRDGEAMMLPATKTVRRHKPETTGRDHSVVTDASAWTGLRCGVHLEGVSRPGGSEAAVVSFHRLLGSRRSFSKARSQGASALAFELELGDPASEPTSPCRARQRAGRRPTGSKVRLERREARRKRSPGQKRVGVATCGQGVEVE